MTNPHETFMDEESNSSQIDDHFSAITNSLSLFKLQITQLQQHMRGLEKEVKRDMRALRREIKTQKTKVARKPSGFAQPTKITDELCEFMGKEKGSMVARTEVTRFVISYIKEHDLQNSNNKKQIIPNNKLKKLLAVKENDEVTYFNLQRYMNIHFTKTKKTKKQNTPEEDITNDIVYFSDDHGNM